MSTDARPDLLSMPTGVRTLTTPDLLAVRGEAALAAWAAWNAALGERCEHELACPDGCRDTFNCCAAGAQLARAEQDAYIAWDVIASDEGVPADAFGDEMWTPVPPAGPSVVVGILTALAVTAASYCAVTLVFRMLGIRL
jgi:hypothetical protein